ncbi:hypothetical protein OIU78_014079 [Salix suchowensis]|nr:hypothetical protein OIU78_014079 [Salix suchowensis]
MGIDPNTHKPRIDPSHILNLSQLLGAAQSGNIASPWNSFLKLQAEVTQLANIQLVRNLLQMMNTNTLTNIENNNSLLGSQNPSLFRALVNGTTSSNTKEPAPISQDLANPPVDSGPEGLNINGNTWSSSYGIQTEQNPLPALVSASTSPVTSIVHQTESKGDPSNYSTTGTPTSTIFEAWEKLIDDDNISSYWNDILD